MHALSALDLTRQNFNNNLAKVSSKQTKIPSY